MTRDDRARKKAGGTGERDNLRYDTTMNLKR